MALGHADHKFKQKFIRWIHDGHKLGTKCHELGT